MSEVEWAWAAGFFEGEGSITRNVREAASIALSVANTDLDRLEEFQRVVGGGAISSETRRPTHRKQQYKWRAYSEEAIRIGEAMLPWLGERRRARFAELVTVRRQHIAAVTAERACIGCGVKFRPVMHANASRQTYCTPACCVRARIRRKSIFRLRPSADQLTMMDKGAA